MSTFTILWINIPLMVIAFGLMTGIPLWLVLRRPDWHGKPETPAVPAYMAADRAAQTRRELIPA